MSDTNKKFYLTTPIYYVNARPHIGHAYTTIAADVIARRQRLLLGRDEQGAENVWFLTGTDEHGQKIQRSAEAAGIPPQRFADQVSEQFRGLWQRMGITYNDYIRTTEPRHKQGVQKLFAELYSRGHIYLDTYTGQYSVGEEMFIDGPPGTIGPDGKLTETVTEENFYFRLSAFQGQLIDLIEADPDDPKAFRNEPEARRNEVLSFLRGNVATPSTAAILPLSEQGEPKGKDPGISSEQAGTSGAPFMTQPHRGMSGNEPSLPAPEIAYSAKGTPYLPGALKDLSISRSSFDWGIPVPEPAAGTSQKKHVIYVWLDALANYMTAVGYGSDKPEDVAKLEKFWPADLHLVGKEIIRFHCVYWPAFLLGLNSRWEADPSGDPQKGKLVLDPDATKLLPKKVQAHGWLLFEESKMSKSRGNIVRTETILDAFGSLLLPNTASSAQKNPPAPKTLSSRPETQSAAAEGSASPEPPPPPTKAQQDLFASDVLRYFLLREIPFGQDGSFSFDALVQRYNSDLANGYGNLVSRTLKMIEQNFSSQIPPHREWKEIVIQVVDKIPKGGRVGSPEDLGPFLSSPDPELARIATAMVYLQEDAFANLRFSVGVEFEQLLSDMRSSAHVRREDRGVLDYISLLITQTDQVISAKQPWKLAKEQTDEARTELADVLYSAAEAIRIITALLYPILPYSTAKVWAQLGLGDIEADARNGQLNNLQWGGLQPGTRLGPLGPIFPRADKGLIQIMTDAEQNSAPPTPSKFVDEKTTHTAPAPPDSSHPGAAPRTTALPQENPGAQVGASSAPNPELARPPAPHTEAHASGLFATAAAAASASQAASEPSAQIAIDDFVKIDLRVARILVAERIPKADKLLRLEVDLGYEKRQILSGIAQWYAPEDLIGRRIIIVANLAPRKMRGLESHGMLLAASHGEDGKPILATFADSDEIELGSRLK